MTFKRIKSSIFLIVFIYLPISAQNNFQSEFYNLSKITTGIHNKRISSSDTTGGNGDNVTYIKPGQKITIATINGSGIINHIWITMSPGPNKLLRNDVIIRMYWDGNKFPSVESPIGPFFGQGWNEQYNYAALPLTAGPGNGTSLICYFAMPFSNGARIEIENQNDIDIEKLYFCIDYIEMKKIPKDVGRFHAWYNHEITENRSEIECQNTNKTGKHNYVFADIKGKGHFVGINYYVQNPTPNWYGEGDDMWYIDGENTPSLKGTGTEDFFNTSWSPKEAYSHPNFGYPRVNNDIYWLGRTHVYRFLINDPIYFDKSLKATIEHGHNNDLTLDLATVAYWYETKAAPLPIAPTRELRKPTY